MVVDYKVLSSMDLDTLEEYVNGLIRKGWEPQGGVSVEHGVIFRYMQAMVKDIDEQDQSDYTSI